LLSRLHRLPIPIRHYRQRLPQHSANASARATATRWFRLYDPAIVALTPTPTIGQSLTNRARVIVEHSSNGIPNLKTPSQADPASYKGRATFQMRGHRTQAQRASSCDMIVVNDCPDTET